MIGALELNVEVDSKVVVTDEYGAMKGRQPATVTRSFDDVGAEIQVDVTMDMMGQVEEDGSSGSGSSPLEGSKVVFTWDEDSGTYTKAFAEGSEGDDDHLAATLAVRDRLGPHDHGHHPPDLGERPPEGCGVVEVDQRAG